jgi:hypothetical protein
VRQFKNKLKYGSILPSYYTKIKLEYLRTNPNGSAALVRYRDNIRPLMVLKVF